MNRLLDYLNQQSRAFFLLTGCLLVVLIGVPDYLLKQSVSFSIFYLIPVFFTAWFAGKWAGMFIACLSALVWYGSDRLSGNPLAYSYIAFWNAFVRLGFFTIVVFLLNAFKREKSFAREDYLTGLGNRRNFVDLAEAEIERSRRYGHSFTLAYIDIDDFKSINDRYGHNEGDALLKSIAGIIKRNVRTTDIHARLGGDEFALLLPETGADRAIAFFNKLHERLSAVVVHERSVTFSVGVVTFAKYPDSIDEVIRIVDQVMYSAKESGKNLVKYKVINKEET